MEVRASECTTLEAERGGRPTSHEFEASMDSMMISEVRLSYKVSPCIKTTTRLGAVDDLLALWC